MTVFIQKGDAPLSLRQASERGLAVFNRELSAAGARMGDETLLMMTPHAQLPARLQAVVAALGHETYADYAAAWEADNAVNAANNLFNHQLAAYRQAVERLARFRLAEGLPEVTEDQDGTIVIVQPAVAPLPATIERPVIDPETGEVTGSETVPNPAIVQDEIERAAAQAVVDGTPVEVKAFVTAL